MLTANLKDGVTLGSIKSHLKACIRRHLDEGNGGAVENLSAALHRDLAWVDNLCGMIVEQRANELVTVTELMTDLDIPRSTMRRYLKRLARIGVFPEVDGGRHERHQYIRSEIEPHLIAMRDGTFDIHADIPKS